MNHIGHLTADRNRMIHINLRRLIVPLLFFLIAGCQDKSKSVGGDNKNTDSISLNNNQNIYTKILAKYPLVTWMRKTPVEIGCMLESEFNFKDSLFNCNYKNYVNNGDPCNKTAEYYQGIKIQAELYKKIHPSIKDISLDFEISLIT